MKKISLIFFPLLTVFLLTGCGKKADTAVISTGTVQGFTTSYVVGTSPSFQKALYGTVIADSIKTISANRGGILEYIDCQPGKQVSKDTIIAKIQANADDPSYQNNQVQVSTLQEQLNNLTKIFSLTEDTLVLQKNILQDQYDNNVQLLDNLGKSQDYSASNMEYQQQLLDQQYEYLKDAKTIDVNKMKTSIATTYKQYLVMIKDALKKVDDVFGIDNATSNVAFDQYVSDRDPSLRVQVEQKYHTLKNKLSTTMSSADFSQYLIDVSDFMALAASSINATTASTALPQSSSLGGLSIDGLYTTYTTLATTFVANKSPFDTLVASYDSVKNTYDNQIQTVDINADNLEEYTAKSTALALENQVANLQLTQKTLGTQLTAADESREIQLIGLKNQLLTLKQNISILSNSLGGEVLYAGVDGIVKMRAIGEDNKVTPNTMLCQILPQNAGNLSLQIFSYQQIPLGSTVSIADEQGQSLGTGTLAYEYPYKDPTTQNYIYEIPVINFPLKENERVLVTSSQLADQGQIWIPLQYISPRLEGNLVRRKVGTGIENVYVTLGNIDGGSVQVLSGLNMGDEIVQ